jgi:hypothetical protein
LSHLGSSSSFFKPLRRAARSIFVVNVESSFTSEINMRALSGLIVAAALVAITGTVSAADAVDVIVVTAKRPATTMLDDMEADIAAETANAVRAQPPLVLPAPEIRVEIPAPVANRG